MGGFSHVVHDTKLERAEEAKSVLWRLAAHAKGLGEALRLNLKGSLRSALLENKKKISARAVLQHAGPLVRYKKYYGKPAQWKCGRREACCPWERVPAEWGLGVVLRGKPGPSREVEASGGRS